jgi:hypothetical protein
MDNAELRRCALQLASQLPSEKCPALAVIRLMHDLVENWVYSDHASPTERASLASSSESNIVNLIGSPETSPRKM